MPVGDERDVLVRFEAQVDGEKGNQRAIQTIREALGASAEFRRVETVGPTVGEELRTAGLYAVLASIAAILVYVWFRFEWQFGVGAVTFGNGERLAVVRPIGLNKRHALAFDGVRDDCLRTTR